MPAAIVQARVEQALPLAAALLVAPGARHSLGRRERLLLPARKVGSAVRSQRNAARECAQTAAFASSAKPSVNPVPMADNAVLVSAMKLRVVAYVPNALVLLMAIAVYRNALLMWPLVPSLTSWGS